MNIAENVSLKTLNTFGIDARAKYLVSISSIDQLIELLNSDVFKQNDSLILGGGSNILLTTD